MPDGKLLNTKWLYSLVAVDGERAIGTAIGYERKPDGTKNYPESSIYLDVLAVASDHQGEGFGGRLLSSFLRGAHDLNQGHYTQLTGPFQFSLTTSTALSNEGVRLLYESFGFHPAVYRQIDGLPYVTMRGCGDEVMQAMNNYSTTEHGKYNSLD